VPFQRATGKHLQEAAHRQDLVDSERPLMIVAEQPLVALCRGHTACRRRPRSCNWRRRTPDGCPRRREIAIDDWTRVGSVRHTAPSRRRGLPCRVLKEARRVTTPCAGLPSCTGLMVAAPCNERPGGEPAEPAASALAAVAKNQSQELRCWGWNQNQPRPPESGGFTPPSTTHALLGAEAEKLRCNRSGAIG
jgi:hypothetical protein